MAKSKSIPDIRFSGFEQEWDKKQFDTVFDMITNNTLSRDNLNYVCGSTQNVHYGDILTVFSEYLDACEENLPYLNDEEVATKYQNSTLKDGDIIIADTAEDEMVGKCVEIGNIGEKKVVAGLHTIPCRPKEKYAPKYMGYYLNSEAYHHKLLPLMQGVKVISVSKTGIKGTEVVLSSEYEEQKKVGDFLFFIDEKIRYEEYKLDKLETYKQAMLISLFPRENESVPAVRFSGFTEKWEKHTLDEIVRIYDGVHQTPKYQDSGVMFLSVENIETLKSDKYISEEAFEKDYKVAPEKGDILMTRIGDVGTTNVVESSEKIAFYVSLALLKSNGTDTYFLSNAMQSEPFKKGLRVRTLTTAIPMKINKEEIGKVEIYIPKDIKEQEKIGIYFRNMNLLIKLQKEKILKLQNIKSACMKRMFV